MQSFIINHYEYLILIAGFLLIFLGIMPIVSKRYYLKNLDTKVDKIIWPFSEKDGYIYGRYIRQIYPLLGGLLLVGIGLYNFF